MPLSKRELRRRAAEAEARKVVPEAITVLAAAVAIVSGIVGAGLLGPQGSDLRRFGAFVLSWLQREADPLQATLVICLVLYLLLAWDTQTSPAYGWVDRVLKEVQPELQLFLPAAAVVIAITTLSPNLVLVVIGLLGFPLVVVRKIRTPFLLRRLVLYLLVALVPVGVFQFVAGPLLHPSLDDLPIYIVGAVTVLGLGVMHWRDRASNRD